MGRHPTHQLPEGKKTREWLSGRAHPRQGWRRRSESRFPLHASHSSSGPGHRPFTAGTGVRTPYGTPLSVATGSSEQGVNSSVVEHRLAKARVGSSNLLSRSIIRYRVLSVTLSAAYAYVIRPIRLVVQDTALSRREQGFEPPMGRHFPAVFLACSQHHSILSGHIVAL